MIRYVLYSESWLPWAVDLKKWQVRKFMESLKFITWHLLVNYNYCQSRKALTLLSAPPFLCSDYITFEVGQWTQFLHWSFFICKLPVKVKEIGGHSLKGLLSSLTSQGPAWKKLQGWLPTTGQQRHFSGKCGLQEVLLSRETNKSIALEKKEMIFFFFSRQDFFV